MSKRSQSRLAKLKELYEIESGIHSKEIKHLEEMRIYEGIIRKNHNTLSNKNQKYTYKRKNKLDGFMEAHKLFSLSSCTSEVNLMRKREIENNSSKLIPNNSNSFIQKRNAGIDTEICMTDTIGQSKGDSVSSEQQQQPIKKKKPVGPKKKLTKTRGKRGPIKKPIQKRQSRRGKTRRRKRKG